MGMFDYVYVDADELFGPNDWDEYTSDHQSKDGPCELRCIQRDAVDKHGAYRINYYYGESGEWRRGPNGWVKIPDDEESEGNLIA